jgi:hypothetical protein
MLSEAQAALCRDAACLEIELERMRGLLSAGEKVDLDLYGRIAGQRRRILENSRLREEAARRYAEPRRGVRPHRRRADRDPHWSGPGRARGARRKRLRGRRVIPLITILEAIERPSLWAPWFRDPATWAPWRTFLAALFGLPMDGQQLATYRECTGRTRAPVEPRTEAWLVCGRRAGKSFVMALVAAYLAAFRDYRPFLAPGERAMIRVMSQDRDQAAVIFRYVSALLSEVPLLAPLIERQTADSIDLTSRVTIETGTASFRASRGYSFAAVLADELAFWRSDDSANPDTEILRATRPGLLTIPGAMLLCASSPYSRRGELWNAFSRWYGDDGAKPLVWRAPTRTMNPTIPAAEIEAKLAEDPAGAAAEYLSEFRNDIADFVTRDAVLACIKSGERERLPSRGYKYVGFTDPSGGASDAFTLAIAHKEGNTAVLDLVREVRPPFSPEAIVEDYADVLKKYRISAVYGDAYGGEWPREQFQKCGIYYKVADRSKSDFYRDLLPLLNSQAVDLLDNEKLIVQLTSLERRTSRGGRDSIDHPKHGHDDVANAVAGALVYASALSGTAADFRQRRAGAADLPATANLGFADIKRGWGRPVQSPASSIPPFFR